MILTDPLFNSNGISSVAFAFFTALFGAVGTVGLLVWQVKQKADEAKDEARETNKKAEQAVANTAKLGNGFASSVGRKLDAIITVQGDQQRTLEDVERSFRDHLAWHLQEGDTNAVRGKSD